MSFIERVRILFKQVLSRRFKWISSLTLVSLAILGIITWLVVYRDQKMQISKTSRESLLAISRFKTAQITEWRRERLADAETVSRTPVLAFSIGRWLDSPDQETGKSMIMGRLQASKSSNAYESVMLLDRLGNIRLSTDKTLHALSSESKSVLIKSLDSRQILFSDFYFCNLCGKIHLDLFVPLVPESNGRTGNAIGAFLFRIDPETQLFPLIESWPTFSPTSESLLVMKKGEYVQFISRLRHRENHALEFQVPLSNLQLPASRAIRGEKGLIEGFDYEGIEVLTAVSHINDSSWYLVCKTDLSEIYSPLKQRMIFVSFISLAILISLGMILVLGASLQQKQYYKSLYAKEIEHQAITKHFEYLVKYANDIILLADPDFHITEVNDRGLAAFKYDRRELLEIKLTDLCCSDMPEPHKTGEVFTKNGMIWESDCLRKDGSVFPGEISARMIETEEKQFIQAIIRDISERRESENAVLEKTAYLNQLFNNIPLATQLCDSSGHILQINPATSRLFGYSVREMAGHMLDELIVPKHKIEEAAVFTERSARGETFIFESQRKRKDNSLFDVQCIAFPVYLEGRLIGAYTIYQDITAAREAAEAVERNMQKLQKAMLETIEALAMVVENRDPYTADHQRRVAELSCAIAREMELDPMRIEGLRVAAIVHDIGKLSIPVEILSKPSKLTDLEFNLIRQHSQFGFDILKEIDFPWPVARMVLEHHERINGSGYPQKLKGEEALLESRILAVADVVEAISSHRPYRPSRGLDTALEEIETNLEILYDRKAGNACLKLFREKAFSFSSPHSP